MLSARDTSLRADADYIRLLDAQSRFSAQYHLARPNPTHARAHPMWADVPGVPGCAVDAENRLMPRHFRVATRAAHNRLQTPLAGRAPFRGLGDGRRYVDEGTRLRHSDWGHLKESRSRMLSEIDLGRLDFVTLPRALTTLPFDSRLGELTRRAPGYEQPRDGWFGDDE